MSAEAVSADTCGVVFPEGIPPHHPNSQSEPRTRRKSRAEIARQRAQELGMTLAALRRVRLDGMKPSERQLEILVEGERRGSEGGPQRLGSSTVPVASRAGVPIATSF